MKRFINSACLVCLLLAAAPAWPDAPSEKAPKDYPACLAAWDNNLQTLQTRFSQISEYDGMLISQSQGRIFYQKNGPKLRLDTLDGESVLQTAQTDKKKIYILDEKGKDISTVSWKDWLAGQLNQALFDFGNYTQLLKKHAVSVQSVTDKQAVLRLAAKNKEDSYTLYVTVGAEDCFPQEITLESDLMKTTASLSKTQRNHPLEKTIFQRLK